MTRYYLLVYASVFIAAIGQILMKHGTNKKVIDLVILQLNPWLMFGLGCMVLSMLLNIRGLSAIPLRDMAFILPTVYILVPLLSFFFLGERMERHAIAGTVLIVIGMILFNLPLPQLF